MGAVTSKVSDDEIVSAARPITPGGLRYAVREWRVAGSSAETSVALFVCYSVRFQDQWREVASGPTAGHLLARLLTLREPIEPPWKQGE